MEPQQIPLKAKYRTAVPTSRYHGHHNDGMKRRKRNKVGRKDKWEPESVLHLTATGKRRFERI